MPDTPVHDTLRAVRPDDGEPSLRGLGDIGRRARQALPSGAVESDELLAQLERKVAELELANAERRQREAQIDEWQENTEARLRRVGIDSSPPSRRTWRAWHRVPERARPWIAIAAAVVSLAGSDALDWTALLSRLAQAVVGYAGDQGPLQ